MVEESYVAASDWIKYWGKPSAIRSENYLHNSKASNGSAFPCTLGWYCNFSTSYFCCHVDMAFINSLHKLQEYLIRRGAFHGEGLVLLGAGTPGVNVIR